MCWCLVQVMKGMCKQGYKDALHFLKKNGETLWFSFVKAVNKPVGRGQIYLRHLQVTSGPPSVSCIWLLNVPPLSLLCLFSSCVPRHKIWIIHQFPKCQRKLKSPPDVLLA